MQTAKDERLHELTLAYIDKSQLQKNGWLMAAVAATLGIFSETMDSALYFGLLPLVYLIFDLPVSAGKTQDFRTVSLKRSDHDTIDAVARNSDCVIWHVACRST